MKSTVRVASKTRPKFVARLVAFAVLFATLAGLAAFLGPKSWTPGLGLDLRGGTQVRLSPIPNPGQEVTADQVQQAVEIIRQRVNGLGVSEADVSVEGSGGNFAVVVSVPGETPDRIVETVGRTAVLNFRPVHEIVLPSAETQISLDDTAATPTTAGTAQGSETGNQGQQDAYTEEDAPLQTDQYSPELQTAAANLNCAAESTASTTDDPARWLVACDTATGARYVMEPSFIKGTSVTNAEALIPQGGAGNWVVSLNLDSEGASALSQASSRLLSLPECTPGQPGPCNAFAIVLDGKVVSAPRFEQAIVGGQAQISGQFTKEQASDLANILKYGALPVTFEVAEVTTISPTIGSEQLSAGMTAAAVGFLLVIIYLIAVYRLSALIPIVSLFSAAGLAYLFVLFMSGQIGLNLTLAGLTGLIVAIGITADSFIVYFARIKDLIAKGMAPEQAIYAAWPSARNTILAADFVTLLAAVTLYIVSIGNVRGFAFMLGLTTVIDIIVAIFFTYPIMVAFARKIAGTPASLSALSGKPEKGSETATLEETDRPQQEGVSMPATTHDSTTDPELKVPGSPRRSRKPKKKVKK